MDTILEAVDMDGVNIWVADADLVDDMNDHSPDGMIGTEELFEVFEDWLEDQF